MAVSRLLVVDGAIQVIAAHALGMEDPVQAEGHVPGSSRAAAQGSTPPLEPNTPDATTPIAALLGGTWRGIHARPGSQARSVDVETDEEGRRS